MEQRGLVEQAQSGDHDAFALLARAAIGRLDGIARLMLRDGEEARDAVQEALIRAWRDLPGLREPGRFDAWLYRLIVHACYDAIRLRRRHQVRSTAIEDVAISVGGGFGTVDDRELLSNALLQLRPDWRAVVVLHYYLGMTLPDVAATLRIPLGTAQSRHHRSLRVLRETIEGNTTAARSPVREGQLA